jgi:lysophospholipase L1-like esterase
MRALAMASHGRMRLLTRSYLVLASALILTACGLSYGQTAQAMASRSLPSTHVVFVALGDSSTRGRGARDPATDSYPAVLARHLPPGATVLNLGTDGATVASIGQSELAAALAARPTLVAVWIGKNDLENLLPAAAYGAELEYVLRAFQRIHARAFVANMPNLRFIAGCGWRAPTYAQTLAHAYNVAIAAVAARHGATVVDLYVATQAVWGQAAFRSDCFHLNTSGYTALAGVFYRVMHAAGAL